MAAAKKPDWPRIVRFESARVRVSRRADGRFALAWREDGAERRTTLRDASTALEWAAQKARDLDAKSGRRWVTQGEAEQLAELHRLAGSGDPATVRELLVDAGAARKILDGGASLAQAARWMADHGPLRIQRANVHPTIKRFLADYQSHGRSTRDTFGTELDGWIAARADGPLLELSGEDLAPWVRRKTQAGAAPAPRTVKNRITTWITLLNRARQWGLLPPGPHAADSLRKPRLADAGREILTVDQARRLLAAVRLIEPRLEAYLLIGGWLGLRPSEIQRLPWDAVFEVPGYVRVRPEVAKKIAQERYIPIDPRVAAALERCRSSIRKLPEDRVAPHRSREYLSQLARTQEILHRWPPDVLRHSYCSYRLAITQDLAKVAEEAGNSPAIIRRHYRRPVTPEDGAAWWELLA